LEKQALERVWAAWHATCGTKVRGTHVRPGTFKKKIHKDRGRHEERDDRFVIRQLFNVLLEY